MIKPDPPISAFAEADLERRLRSLPLAPGPDPRFRAELRVQLLAAVERGVHTETPAADRRLHLAGGRHAAARPGGYAPPRSARSALPDAKAGRFAPAYAKTGRRVDLGARAGRLATRRTGAGRLPLAGASRFAFLDALHLSIPRFPIPRVPIPQLSRRAVSVLGAAVAVLLVFTGTTYWLAQRALPGDALYGLKRASETVDLSTKQGDVSRGGAYLSLSTTRIDEAAALVQRATSAAEPGTARRHPGLSAAGPLSPHVDELVHDVLADGDTSAVTATRLLTTAAVSNRAQKPVISVTTWLSDQRGKVSILVARLPETAPTTAGGAARILARDLVAIQARVKAITVGVRCTTCQFPASDRLGPLPCHICPSPVSAPKPTHSKTTSPTTLPAPTIATTPPVPPATDPTTSATVPGSVTSTTNPPPSPAPAPAPITPEPTPLPSTPTTSPTDPGSPTPTPAPPTTTTTSPTPTTDPPTSTDPSFDPTCLPDLCSPSAAAATS